MINKKYFAFLIMILGLPISIECLALNETEDEYRTQQAYLDQACEAARERKLAPERQRFIEECENDSQRIGPDCKNFYSTYGDRTGSQAPLYYDLPECVQPHEYRKNYRSGD